MNRACSQCGALVEMEGVAYREDENGTVLDCDACPTICPINQDAILNEAERAREL